jgi:hypothetical protein
MSKVGTRCHGQPTCLPLRHDRGKATLHRELIVTDRPHYLTAHEVAERIGLKVRTLANWRSDPRRPGPPFHKFGNRIRYVFTDVLEWEKRHHYGATVDYDLVEPPSSLDPGDKLAGGAAGPPRKSARVGRRRRHRTNLSRIRS